MILPELCRAFGSLFQGDHLGVEIASEAHAGLLMSHGLLPGPSRLVANLALVEDEVVQGLYIDDFFIISKEDLAFVENDASESKAVGVFHEAKEDLPGAGHLWL